MALAPRVWFDFSEAPLCAPFLMSRSLRSLLKSPLFFASAVATLAVGIGASTTVFSVLHSIVLRPLGYPEAADLMLVRSWKKSAETAASSEYNSSLLSGAEFTEFTRSVKSFSKVAAMRYDYANLTKVDAPTQISIGPATEEFFSLLAVPPRLGRTWNAEDCQADAPKIVVLSHALWKTKFGSDAQIIGRSITLNDTPRTVIGVMPATFKDPLGDFAAAWIPVGPDSPLLADRTIRWFATIGRLQPGVTRKAAADEVAAFAEQLGKAQPDMTGDWRWEALPLGNFLLERSSGGFVATTAASLALLLITCSNVAGLMIARAQQRRRETSVRSALGASFRDLVREALAEGGWISLFGGLLGATLAFWGVELTRSGLLPSWFPRTDEVALRPLALGFVMVVSALTALACGFIPLLYRKENVSQDLRAAGSGQSAAPGASRLRRALVVAEIALAVALLSVAGLAMRSFIALRAVPLGAQTDHVLALTLNVRDPRLTEIAQYPAYYASLLEKVRALPGVSQVGITSTTPFMWGIQLPFVIEGQAIERGKEPNAFMDAVNADYFSALGVKARAGRLIEPTDITGAAAVCVVSDTFARAHFPTGNAIGQHLRLLAWGSETMTEIVGITPDVRRYGAQAAAPSQVYVPFQQKPWNFSTLLVRSQQPVETLQNAVQKAIWSVNPNQPVNDVRTLEMLANSWMEMPRVWLRLFATFGVMAVFLAGVGIYGLMAFVVTQRTREFGIRLALGAEKRQIFSHVLREGAVLVVIGAIAGVGAAVAIANLLRGLVYGVALHDPASLLGGAALLAVVALVAAAVPARRATRLDPILALRAE